MPILEEENRAATPFLPVGIEERDWESLDKNTYECRVLLCPEEGNRFSAHALRLPGVASEGDSIEEALKNIAEAFRGAIAVYREYGEDIPWEAVEVERTNGSLERWILVNV